MLKLDLLKSEPQLNSVSFEPHKPYYLVEYDMYLCLFIFPAFLDENPGWVQVALSMTFLMRRIRLGVNQLTFPCGNEGPMKLSIVVYLE
jgi:hypothetical protein